MRVCVRGMEVCMCVCVQGMEVLVCACVCEGWRCWCVHVCVRDGGVGVCV